MLKVGLTGGIGCGKSTVTDAFRVLGVSIIDADQISKDIVKPGKQALKEISETFNESVISDNGELDRNRLKEIVFSDPEALEKLEEILHPRIREEIDRQISEHSNKPYIIVDVPLLVEKNYQSLFDRIIVVDCLPEQQFKRVNKRDGITENKILKIIQTQAGRKARKKYATDILDNTGRVENLQEQIKALHELFIGLSGLTKS